LICERGKEALSRDILDPFALGVRFFLSDELEDKFVDSASGESTTEGADELNMMGVDLSMGKEGELFRVGLKNVMTLEKRLAPASLGKKTGSLFLEQIDDMTAYPRHTNHKNSEGLRDFVEAVTYLINLRGGRQGGALDLGWKVKHRNSMETIKITKYLSNALTYLLGEQHSNIKPFSETCSRC